MLKRKDLRKLSKNELIDLLFEEQKARQDLENRLKKVEHYLKAFDNAHTPSSKKLKKNTKTKEDDPESSDDQQEPRKPRFPGKPPGGKGGGIKLPEPDKIEEHKLDVCPLSGEPLGKPVSYRVKTIIDFPDKPIQTIEHRIMQYISPVTGEIIEADVDLPEKNIYGKNIQSDVIMLKELTNSQDKIFV